MSAEQIEHWKSCFGMFDTDGSGKISRREIVDLLQKCGKSEDDAKAIAYNIMKADEDQDGTITWEEFRDYLIEQYK